MSKDPRIPVTLLTGFLGSGKTTFLNALIAHHPHKKFAIIENEFGSESIDHDLIISTTDDIFELSNGCLCCSLHGDLLATLHKILQNPQKVDHLIVETTGLADPEPVALSFLTDTEVQQHFRMDAVITLVDALSGEQRLIDTEEANKQLALADVVLITKSELAEEYSIEVLSKLISQINPTATVLLRTRQSPPPAHVLDLQSFSNEGVRRTLALQRWENRPRKRRYTLAGSDAPQGMLSLSRPVHHAKYHTITLHSEQPLDVLKFDAFIKLLLHTELCPIYRVKGFLHVDNFADKIVFQAVGSQYLTEEGGPWGDRPKASTLVVIGKNLDAAIIQHVFALCASDGTQEYDESFFEQLMAMQEALYLHALGQAPESEA